MILIAPMIERSKQLQAIILNAIGSLFLISIGHTQTIHQFPKPDQPTVGSFIKELNGTLLFPGYSNESGRELWRSDGTEAGTILVKDIGPTEFDGLNIAGDTHLYNAHLFFNADVGDHSTLWKSDGTPTGTSPLEDASGNSLNGGSFINWRNTLYFWSNQNGKQGLYRSDGTNTGTFLVSEFSADYLLEQIHPIGDYLVFMGYDEATGLELWRSDGTPTGTQILFDIHPGPNSSAPQHFTKSGNNLFFEANDGNHGRELWKTDGTTTGTALVKDINQGVTWSNVSITMDFNGSIIFVAEDSLHGRELWRSDGSTAGTWLLNDFKDGPFNSRFGPFAKMGDRVYFWADSDLHGSELWRTDGTPDQTELVKDIYEGNNGSDPSWMASLRNQLIFPANDGIHGNELWKSDGTATGTQLILDASPGIFSSFFDQPTMCYGNLFFRGLSDTLGSGLWTTSGTTNGTLRLGAMEPLRIACLNGELIYFSDNSGGEDLRRHPLTTWNLTIRSSPTGAGVTSGSGRYINGVDVPISASPNSGYRFIGWEDGPIESPNEVSTTIQMVDNFELIAIFTDIPILSIRDNAYNVIECGDDFTHPDATAFDHTDGDLSSQISMIGPPVNPKILGIYPITYTVTDNSGNTASVTRTYEVIDTLPPTISLNGPSTLTLIKGDQFTETVSARDLCDEAVDLIIGGDILNTEQVGSYTLTYNAIDSSGNVAREVHRTIEIIDSFPTQTIKAYRLALAATAEFTDYHGGKAEALAAMKEIVAATNRVYLRDAAIELQLIEDTTLESIIYTDPDSDPFTPGDLATQLAENQATLDAIVGNENYDIGHVLGHVDAGAGFSTIGGGSSDATKGRGVTEAPDPSAKNEAFIGLFVHELAHQLGAEHTYNATESFCGDERWAETAVEPGSGTTLMSYAGSCESADLQPDRDLYFHALSMEHLRNTLAIPFSTRASANTPPVVVTPAGFSIPARTPFELTAEGMDANGDPLVYTWEQMDVAEEAMNLPLADDGKGPLFRSLPPSPNPQRTFPALGNLLDGTTSAGELLPTNTRKLTFRTTARDDYPGGGATAWADVVLDVVDTGRAFEITSMNTMATYDGGSIQTLTWDVAGTDGNGIDTPEVDIFLSIDGGLHFSYRLTTTVNDGTVAITLPNISETNCRLKIQGHGNVFFDISDESFAIVCDPNQPGVKLLGLNDPLLISEGSEPGSDFYIDTYEIALNTDPGESVTIQAVSDDKIELSLDGVDFTPTVEMAFTSTTAQTLYVRAIDDEIIGGTEFGIITHAITASSSSSYPEGMLISAMRAKVNDNDRLPFVGVGFSLDAESIPQHWNAVSNWDNSGSKTYEDLTMEGGDASNVSLAIHRSGHFQWGNGATAPLIGGTVPQHDPPLDSLDHVFLHNTTSVPLILTWEGLEPETEHLVYLLASQNFGLAIDQEVLITGGGDNDPTSFSQVVSSTANRQLIINEELGSSSEPLESYGIPVTSTQSGTVQIELQGNAGSAGVFLSGVAIEQTEAPLPPPEITVRDSEDGGALIDAEGSQMFPDAVINAGNSVKSFVIRNTGGSDLRDLSVSLTGNDASGFSASDTSLPSLLQPLQQAVIDVSFQPTNLGGHEATLLISSNDADENPFEIALSGTGITSRSAMEGAIAEAGLSSEDTLPSAVPFDDGVPNLLKYAFNMDLSMADPSTMTLGGTSGLPGHEIRTGSEGETIFHVEFVRRRGSGLIYTPKKSESPDNDSFVPMTGTVTVTPIDDQWERVSIDEICAPGTPRCFSHVEVTLP